MKIKTILVCCHWCYCLSTLAQVPVGSALLGKTASEQFGRVVRISADGTVVAVAAPFNSELADKNGRIAIYKSDGKDWSMMGAELYPETKREFEFGAMMELSEDGQKLIVATYFGGISLYSFDGANWIKSILPFQMEGHSDMIEAIATSADGEKIAVAYESSKHRAICINTLRFDGETWLQDGDQIIPYPNEKIYAISLSLSGDGNQLLVGNYSKDTKNIKDAGEVIFFSKEGNQWLKSKSITGEAAGANLGKQVTISKNGNMALAASNSIDITNRSAGFVNSYELLNNSWDKKFKSLKPEKSNSYFGHAIAVSANGNVLAVSMPYLGFAKPGFVEAYNLKTSGWKKFTTITDDNGVETTRPPNNTVGWSIALSSDGRRLVVGFPHNDENGDMSGKVIVYNLDSF